MAKAVNPNRVYEDYDPPSDLVTEEKCDTILIYLPGYKKEQLRVQLTTSRILKISGERRIGDNKWRRFNKEFRVSTNCDTKEITAKFEGGILYISQPKLITPAGAPQQPSDKGKAAAVVEAPELPSPQQAPRVPPPQMGQQTPDLTHPQPQQDARDLRQPQAQPQTRDAPQSQMVPQAPLPHYQLEQQASLPELQKGPEKEKIEQKESKEDAMSKEERGKISKENEEGKDHSELTPMPKQLVGGGLFRELRKPENFKRLVVSVFMVLSIGFYTTYMFKSFTRDD